jgi:hypothetical protein
MNLVRKPWFFVVLDRMSQRAKGICPVEILQRLGDRIISSELLDRERSLIIVYIDLMLQEDSAVYDQGAISYLKTLRNQVAQAPWYVTMLDEIAMYAKSTDMVSKMMLREAVQDFRLIETKPNERISIIAELERMLKDDRHSYTPATIQCLELLLVQVRTGF